MNFWFLLAALMGRDFLRGSCCSSSWGRASCSTAFFEHNDTLRENTRVFLVSDRRFANAAI